MHIAKTVTDFLLFLEMSLIVLGAVLLFSEIVYNLSLPSSGFIRTVGVKAYWDADLKEEANEIQWGTTYIGVPINITLYLYSVSSVRTVLNLETENWMLMNSGGEVIIGPPDSVSFINFTWSYNGTALNPKDTISVNMTLLVENSPEAIDFIINNDVSEFTFVISITSDEQFQPTSSF